MQGDSLVPFYITLIVMLALFVFFIISYLIIHKQKQNAYQSEKDRLVSEHHNKLLIARVEEQERTMDQISKELHDHIGQLLSFAKMSMFVVSKHATHPAQIETIDSVKTLLDKLIVDVQNVSHNLNGEFIKKHGLIKLIQDELNYMNIAGKTKCKLEIVGTHITFEPDKELLIYRIMQEALHNATKHAKATKLTITLEYLPDVFSLCIHDDGVGFDTQKIYELKGIGFLNMLQRTKLLNGTLNVHSAPGDGCKITVRIAEAEGTGEVVKVDGAAIDQV